LLINSALRLLIITYNITYCMNTPDYFTHNAFDCSDDNVEGQIIISVSVITLWALPDANKDWKID